MTETDFLNLVFSFIAAYIFSGFFIYFMELGERSIDQSMAVREGQVILCVLTWPILSFQSKMTPPDLRSSIAFAYFHTSRIRRFVILLLAAMPVLLPFWFLCYALRILVGDEYMYFWLIMCGCSIGLFVPLVNMILGPIFSLYVGLVANLFLWFIFRIPISILVPKRRVTP